MSRTVTRGLTALALGGLTSLTMISPAHADPCPAGFYPPGSNDCTAVSITVTVVANGQTFTVTFQGFARGAQVVITIYSTPIQLGTFTADANGAVTAKLTLPDGFPAGHHTLVAQGQAPDGSTLTLTAPLTVTSTANGSGLPFTGFELGAASLLGAGLLGAGTLAVVSGRKRKDSVTAV